MLYAGREAVPCPALSYETFGARGRVRWRGQAVGRVFEMHPKPDRRPRRDPVSESRDDARARSGREALHAAAALSFERIRSFRSRESRELAGDLLKKLTGFVPADMLESAEYVRQYSGPPSPRDSRAIVFRLTVGSAHSTLSSDEVGAIRNDIIAGMRGLGYRTSRLSKICIPHNPAKYCK
jgi:hypothetical protein